MTEVAAGVPSPRSAAFDSPTSMMPVVDQDNPPEDDAAPVADPAAMVPAAPEEPGLRGVVGERVGEVVEHAGDAVERAAAASGRIAAHVVDRLRNNAELAADRGVTTIADEVVEKIAGIAAREVAGVFDLGGDVARMVAHVRERVGLGEADEQADRGVHVRLEGRTAAIKVVLVIEYGFVVYTVAEKVRAKVISAVESLLGLEVIAVDILVDDVHVPNGHEAHPIVAEAQVQEAQVQEI